MFRIKYRVYSVMLLLLIVFVIVSFFIIEKTLKVTVDNIENIKVIEESPEVDESSSDSFVELINTIMQNSNLEIENIDNQGENVEIEVKCHGNEKDIQDVLNQISETKGSFIVDDLIFRGEECTFKVIEKTRKLN